MAIFNSPWPQVLRVKNGTLTTDGGATLTFFNTGTSTPKIIYSDADFTLVMPNPVTADADGRFPEIFLNGVYKVVLKDSDGTTIQTADPIGGVSNNQFADWSSDMIFNIPDIVRGSDDNYYRTIVDSNQGLDPITSPAAWEKLSFGRIYNANVTYNSGDTVYDANGILYRSLVGANLNNTPSTSPTQWTRPLAGDLITETSTHEITVDADYTLTAAQNRSGRIVITDTTPTLTAARNIVVADDQRAIFAQNNTAQNLTFKTSGGTGVVLLPGSSKLLVCDGTNVISSDAGTLIDEIIVSGGAVTSVTFSGLDIGAHKQYTIVAEVINPVASAAAVYLFPNGDTVATNYYSQFANFASTAATLGRTNTPAIMGYNSLNPSVATITVTRNPTNSIYMALSDSCRNTGSAVTLESFAVSSTGSVGNITSLTLTSTVASSIANGSSFRIYRGDI